MDWIFGVLSIQDFYIEVVNSGMEEETGVLRENLSLAIELRNFLALESVPRGIRN